MPELVYQQATAEYAEAIVELELVCFPTIHPGHLLTAGEVIDQESVFPEGGFVVLDGDAVVGMASGIFTDFDLSVIQHSLDDLLADGIHSHDPDGDWYYGIDIAVHPEYRGHGIGRRLYDMRKQLVRDFERRGIIAGGVLPGFIEHKDSMTADAYVRAVAAGELYDATLSFQLANGFELLGAIASYVDDPETDGWASFIVWYNDAVVDDSSMRT